MRYVSQSRGRFTAAAVATTAAAATAITTVTARHSRNPSFSFFVQRFNKNPMLMSEVGYLN
jgi:hypothetical protein